MATDNTVLSTNVGTGDTVRDFNDGSNVKWPAGVVSYITGGSASSWTVQYVELTHALPVQPGTGVTFPVSVASVPSHDVTNAGTFAVQAAQSGTWNVGTVTSITNVVHIDDNSGSITVDNNGTFAVQATLSAGAAVIGHVISDSGSTTAVTGNVTVIQGTGTNLHTVVDSGTVTANAGTNLNTSLLALDSTLTSRAQKSQVTDGTRDGTVKAASTASIAADTSLVVAMSPNSPVPAGSNVIGHVIADSGSTTAVTGNVTVVQATGTNLHAVIDSGSTTAVTGNVTVIQGTGTNLHTVIDSGTLTTITNVVHVDDNAGSLTVDNNGTFAVQATIAAGASAIAKAEDVASANADVGVPAMAIRKASPANTSDTDGDYEMLQMSAGRVWASATIDAALPTGANVIGAVTQSAGPWTNNVTQFGSTNVSTGTGASGAGIPRVTVSNDSNVLATQSGTWNIGTVTSLTQFNGNAITTNTGAVGAGVLRVTLATDVALPAGTNAIGKLSANDGVDIGDVTINNAAGASAVNIQDGGNSITIDSTQLPSALVSGRLDANVGSWLGSTLPTVAQKAMASSLPVAIASDQSAIPASQSGTWTVQQGGAPWSENLTQVGGVAISTGTGASGTGIPRVTVSNDSNILATQSGTWTVQQGNAPWSENISQYGGTATTLGQKTMSASIPVVLASDQNGPLENGGNLAALVNLLTDIRMEMRILNENFTAYSNIQSDLNALRNDPYYSM